MKKPSEIFDTPEATGFSQVGGIKNDLRICNRTGVHTCRLGSIHLNEREALILNNYLTTKDQEKEEVLGRILALKINMPSEREYSTNPTSAYRTGFEQAVSIYRDRIKSLTHRG